MAVRTNALDVWALGTDISAGVPILNHDLTWGRETNCCSYPERGPVFDPFARDNPPAPENETRNPQVSSLSLAEVQTRLRLRDPIKYNWTDRSEHPSSLQNVLDFMKRNRIAMVITLDTRDAATMES